MKLKLIFSLTKTHTYSHTQVIFLVEKVFTFSVLIFRFLGRVKKMSDESDSEEKQLQFHQMELDDRILKAIALMGWLTPTLIQEKAIPLLLEGKDVLVRAKTGSGKELEKKNKKM